MEKYLVKWIPDTHFTFDFFYHNSDSMEIYIGVIQLTHWPLGDFNDILDE